MNVRHALAWGGAGHTHTGNGPVGAVIAGGSLFDAAVPAACSCTLEDNNPPPTHTRLPQSITQWPHPPRASHAPSTSCGWQTGTCAAARRGQGMLINASNGVRPLPSAAACQQGGSRMAAVQGLGRAAGRRGGGQALQFGRSLVQAVPAGGQGPRGLPKGTCEGL